MQLALLARNTICAGIVVEAVHHRSQGVEFWPSDDRDLPDEIDHETICLALEIIGIRGPVMSKNKLDPTIKALNACDKSPSTATDLRLQHHFGDFPAIDRSSVLEVESRDSVLHRMCRKRKRYHRHGNENDLSQAHQLESLCLLGRKQ